MIALVVMTLASYMKIFLSSDITALQSVTLNDYHLGGITTIISTGSAILSRSLSKCDQGYYITVHALFVWVTRVHLTD